MAKDLFQLVVRKGPRPGQVFALELDVLIVGRDPISDIVLDDPEVSRHHAKFTRREGGYDLQDTGSTNGTFVDGKRLAGEPILLKPGQVIMLGSNITLVYQAAPVADPLATVVAPVVVAGTEISEPEPAMEEPAELQEVEAVLAEPAVVERVEVEAQADLLEGEEEDALATMYEEGPPGVVEPQPGAALPTFEQPEEEAKPEPLPTFEETTPEPEVEELPKFEEPAAFPSFEESEPAEEPATSVGMPSLAKVTDSGEPLADFYEQPAGEPASIGKMDVAGEVKDNNRNRNLIIAVVAIVLLCCCCLIILAALYFTTDSIPDFTALDGLRTAAISSLAVN